jgi:hypothetical protein
MKATLRNTKLRVHASTALALAASLLPAALHAEDSNWDLGLRAIVLAADAPPANDMPGYGLVLHRRVGEHWRVGLALDVFEFDYEEPYKVLGIAKPDAIEAIDGVNESQVLSAFVERQYGGAGSSWRWFWTAGAGFATIDVPVVRGPTAAGGSFDIRTEAEDEVHLVGSAGVRRRLGARWSLEAALHLQHHMLEYRLFDAVTGRTATLEGQTPWGASIGLYGAF